MNLLIDTTEGERIVLGLVEKKKIVAKHERRVFQISENLLPEIGKFLKRHRVSLKSLAKILVNPGPGGFSSTRTGVATANALAYALGIPVAEYPSGKVRVIVMPKYDKLPNITKPKRRV